MASKYAIITNGYQTLKLRKWDGEYYWWVTGAGYKGYGEWRKVPAETAPYVEEEVKKYNGEWRDSPQEAQEYVEYVSDLKRIEELMDCKPDSPEEKELRALSDKVYAYEEKYYPVGKAKKRK